MKKLSKVVCLVLTLAMLMTVPGMSVLAEEPAAGAPDAGTTALAAGQEEDDAALQTDADAANDPADIGTEKDPADTGAEKDPAAAPEENDAVENTGDTEPKAPAADGAEAQPDSAETIGAPSDTLTGDMAVTASESTDAVNIGVKRADKDGELKVSWEKQGEITEYTVKVTKEDPPDTEETVESVQAGDSDTEVSCNITVTKGVKYKIEVFKKETGREGTGTGTGTSGSPEELIGTARVIWLAAPTVTVTEGNGQVALGWSKVAGADGYKVKNETDKSAEIEVKAEPYMYKFTGLKNGTEYTFTVKATAADKTPNGTKLIVIADETSVSGMPFVKPGKVKNLTGIDGDKSAVLTWTKAKDATSYVVERYDKTWKKVAEVKENTYTDKGLKVNTKYKYRVYACNGHTAGDVCDPVTVSVKKTPGTKIMTMNYKIVIKSNAPAFKTEKAKKKCATVKKGTRATAIDYAKGRYQIKLSSGKTYWVSKIRVTRLSCIYTTKDYSTQSKENFVNSKGYKSKTQYLIWINTYTQKVIIFEGKKKAWKMIRSCKCTTGTQKAPTPPGVHKITYKEKGWFYRTTYEKPVVHFSKVAFHSRIHNYKGGYSDPTIGKPRSKGCVRLYDKDIQWIYKNCKKGTTVVVY